MPLSTKLRRYMLTVTKDKVPGSDPAQIPAAAALNVHKQGATVKTAFTVPPGIPEEGPLEVYDVGRVAAGDTIQIFRNGAFQGSPLTVLLVPDATHIEVRNDTGTAVSGVVGDRLVVTTNRPSLYTESSGVNAYGSSLVNTDPSTGTIPPMYTRERFFDGIISGSGFTSRLLVDQPSGNSYRVYDIRDFGGDIQAVLNYISDGLPIGSPPHLEAGGIVYIPRGNWPQTAKLTIRGGRVIIEGDGWDSRIIGKDRNTHVFEIIPQPLLSSHAYDICFRDLMIKGNWGGTAGSGNGVHWAASGSDRGPGLHMDHVTIIECGNDGLHLENVDFPVIIDCAFNGNGRDGAHMKNVAQSSLLGFYANTNQRWGLYCEDGGGHFVQATGIEQNHSLASAVAADGQLKFLRCGGVITRSQFEGFTQGSLTTGAKTAIDLDAARSVVVEGCGFTTSLTGPPPSPPQPTATGIRVRNASKSVFIGPNAFNNCLVCVDVSDSLGEGIVVLPQDDQLGNGSIVSFPSGTSADGWRGLLSLVQNPLPGGGMKVPGLRLPFIGSFPGPDANNEGTLVYHRGAERGHKLKLSDGIEWWPVGGLPSYSAATRPTGVAAGTLIWVTDAIGGSRLQVWDGTGWRVVPYSIT